MTSFDPSTEAQPRHWPSAVWAASAFWLAAGGIASTASIRAAAGSGRMVVLGAALFSLAAFGIGLAMSSLTGRAHWFAGGLLVSGLCAPTTFAYLINLVPIVTGFALLVWARRVGSIRDS
jgi:hypothetical protein